MWSIKKFWKNLWLPVVLAVVMIPACAPATAQMEHHARPPMQKAFHMHFGRWWDNPHVARKLGLTSEQQKKMNQIFQQHRPELIQLHAELQKQEAILRPLIGADHPDKAKILSQIDAVAQARANLEKEFARMLLGIRSQLTPEQWHKLKVMFREHQEQMHHHGWHHGTKEGMHHSGGSGSGSGSGAGSGPTPPPSPQR